MRQSRNPVKLASLLVGAMVLIIFLSPFSVSQISTQTTIGTPLGWSNEINLSDTSMRDQYCSIAVNNQNIHVIWRLNYTDLVFSTSSNGGKTWTPFSSIYHNSAGTILYDDIGVSGQNVHTVVGDFQGWDGVYYRNSIDGGQSWNPVRRINSNGIDGSNPSIFVNNSNVHTIWHDFRTGLNGQIFYRRSLDGGTTFDNGQGLDEDRQITFSPSTIGAVKMAGDGSNISAIWYDQRNGNFDLYWTISKDNGYTWEDGLGNVGQDRRLTTTGDHQHAIAVNGSNIYIVYVEENWPGPTDTLYYLSSNDLGVTWNFPVLLSGPNSASNAPNIKVSGDNIWVMWNDNRDGSHEIFYKNSTDGGINWNPDTRLTDMDGYYSGGPKIALNETNINVIWEDERNGSNQEIYYKRSPDFPDLTPPSHTNETPFPDSYKDAPGTNVSVCVTDPSGVNESTIQLWVNGSLVPHSSMPIMDGFNVSWVSGGFGSGVITCRIIAEDMLGNVLDYTWNFTVLATYNVPLFPGWNLVSLPLEQIDTSPQTILGSIAGQYDVLKYYDALDKSDPWKTYRPGSSVNDLTSIDNTIGIWVHATEYCNLTVHGIMPTSTQVNLYAGWNLVGYPSQTTDTVANVLWGTGADRVEVFDPASPYIKEAEPTYIMKPGEGYWVHVPADTVWAVSW